MSVSAPPAQPPPMYQQPQQTQQPPMQYAQQPPMQYGQPPMQYPPPQQYSPVYMQPQSPQMIQMQPVAVIAPPAASTIVTGSQIMTHSPARVTCPFCKADVVTNVNKTSGVLVWGLCVGLFCIGFGFGCCLIPFCIDGLKDSDHSCPNCSRTISHKSAL